MSVEREQTKESDSLGPTKSVIGAESEIARSTSQGSKDVIACSLEECSVCTEIALEVDEVCRRLACGHVFHAECINAWMQRQNTCPNCRKSF